MRVHILSYIVLLFTTVSCLDSSGDISAYEFMRRRMGADSVLFNRDSWGDSLIVVTLPPNRGYWYVHCVREAENVCIDSLSGIDMHCLYLERGKTDTSAVVLTERVLYAAYGHFFRRRLLSWTVRRTWEMVAEGYDKELSSFELETALDSLRLCGYMIKKSLFKSMEPSPYITLDPFDAVHEVEWSSRVVARYIIYK